MSGFSPSTVSANILHVLANISFVLLSGRRAKRSYPTFKVRRGGCEKIPSSKVRSSSCTLPEQP